VHHVIHFSQSMRQVCDEHAGKETVERVQSATHVHVSRKNVGAWNIYCLLERKTTPLSPCKKIITFLRLFGNLDKACRLPDSFYTRCFRRSSSGNFLSASPLRVLLVWHGVSVKHTHKMCAKTGSRVQKTHYLSPSFISLSGSAILSVWTGLEDLGYEKKCKEQGP
jgi:hypothetical protein